MHILVCFCLHCPKFLFCTQMFHVYENVIYLKLVAYVNYNDVDGLK